MRHFLAALGLILLAGIVFLLVGLFWWRENLKPVDKQSQTYTLIVIKKGSSGVQIAKQLRLNNLIKSQKAFLLYLKLYPISLQAGTFKLSRSMSLAEIVQTLHKGPLDIWVTIPEGWRRGQIGEKLSRSLEFKFSQKAFLKLTTGREGYLFPDTYLFPQEATASRIVKIMVTNFTKKARPVVEKTAQKQNLSLNQVVTLASLVEREGKTKADRRIIASILLKRLDRGWPLQVDATLQYVKGRPGNWWPKIKPEDKKIKSAFNTYLNKGLPPRPISNPGLDSLNAVYQADPNTPYWFYISDKNGQIKAVKTLEEHNQNVSKYLK